MFFQENRRQCPSIFQNTFSHPYAIEKLLLISYPVIFLIGFVGNIMTIIIIKYNTHLRTPTNFYLLNLAVSDLMMLTCNLPLEMIEIAFRQWPLSVVFCRLRNICAEFFTCSSILTILAFTCERYLAIVRPIYFHQLTHFRRAQNVILIIWFISLVFSVPLGFSYEIQTNVVVLTSSNNPTDHGRFFRMNETRNISCHSCVPKQSLDRLLSVVMIIISCCFFYVPMLTIGTIYLFIGKALSRLNQYENHAYSDTSLSSISNSIIIGKQRSYQSGSSSQQTDQIGSYSRLKTRARCEARKVVVKTLVAVVIAFFVCYAPLYLQRLLSAIMVLNSNLTPDSQLFSDIMAYLYVTSGITFYLGSVINPILYNVVSNKYRRAFRDLFCCRLTYNTRSVMKNQRKLPRRNRSNHQPVYYFVHKPPSQVPNPQLHLYSKQEPDQTITFPMRKRGVLANAPSSRSNSSSVSSHNREHCQTPLPASLPKKCQIPRQTKFSLRRKLLGQKQAHDGVPWLTTGNRT